MIHEPTIIGIADGTHYLVGVTDNNGNFSSLPSLKSVAICQSLADAKQVLRDQHIETATLNLQSAYDEMCGLATPSITSETIFL
ncbi:DUF6482 family protein [Psychrobium sp. nBUS_13]|uniref:DUF6482 family protein n=1 Tax=Psychrobium sp. nBUS_13 TaxID=3395319 RepID=UPI003EBC6B8F